MEEHHYQSIIEEIWQKLKKKPLYPEIPMPKVRDPLDQGKPGAEEDEGVGLEMKQKQMTINGAFVSKMKGKMPEKKVIEALLDHGITHYTFCPWDFHTHLRLYAEAKKVVGDKELAKQVSNYFIDVIADTHCVKKRFTEIPELHRNLKKGAIDEVIAFLYQKIWGIDLGIQPWFSRGQGPSDAAASASRGHRCAQTAPGGRTGAIRTAPPKTPARRPLNKVLTPIPPEAGSTAASAAPEGAEPPWKRPPRGLAPLEGSPGADGPFLAACA